MAQGSIKEIVGYGVERQWVVDALSDVVDMAQKGILQGDPSIIY